MSYEYVKRTYSVRPVVGHRVQHLETGRSGRIAREKPSQSHYVQVLFDGDRFARPCHPTALEYAAR